MAFTIRFINSIRFAIEKDYFSVNLQELYVILLTFHKLLLQLYQELSGIFIWKNIYYMKSDRLLISLITKLFLLFIISTRSYLFLCIREMLLYWTIQRGKIYVLFCRISIHFNTCIIVVATPHITLIRYLAINCYRNKNVQF